MIDLAKHSNGEYVSLNSIAERQDVSLNYLEHAFSLLKKAGLIIGQAGSQGGYMIVDDPEKITILSILNVLEGDLSVVDNISKKEETPMSRCIREHIWDKININIREIIVQTTLKDMMDE